MNDLTFPSGPWVGFYTYGKEDSRKHLMDLILEFRNGVMSGEGADGIGMFIIAGKYDPENGECLWTKRYVGRHSVEYTGFREARGIWGTWEINAWAKGGFHIWPIGHETSPLVNHEAVEQEKRQENPVPATAEPAPAP